MKTLKPRPYARIAQDLDGDPDVAALSSDSVRYAFVVAILKAKPLGGRYESRAQLDAIVGRERKKALDEIIRLGLISENGKAGALVLRAWEKWQTNPLGFVPKSDAERAAEYRARHTKKARTSR